MNQTAALLLIGNELLQGEITDSNLPYIATKLQQHGIQLTEARVVPDSETVIIETINYLRNKNDYLFTTGGIGPTHDDITTHSVGKAFGVPIVRNEMIAEQMRLNQPNISEVSLRMADIPVGATPIDNPISIAPGFAIANVYVLAGVPAIMQAMLGGILPQIKKGAILYSRSLHVFAVESAIATTIESFETSLIKIGSYPTQLDGLPCVRLTFRSHHTQQLTQTIERITARLQSQGFQVKQANS